MALQSVGRLSLLRAATISVSDEDRNLPPVHARTPLDVHEFVAFDGCSVNDTITPARWLWSNVRIVVQTCNGKRHALGRVYVRATGDITVIAADGSVNPGKIRQLLTFSFDGTNPLRGTVFAEGGVVEDFSNA